MVMLLCSLSCLPLHAPSCSILTPSQPVDVTLMQCVTVVEVNTESLLHLLELFIHLHPRCPHHSALPINLT